MNDKGRRQRAPAQGTHRPFDPHSFGNMKPSRLLRQQKRGWKRGRK